MDPASTRCVSPQPRTPVINISNVPYNKIINYIKPDELLVSNGYPAPLRGENKKDIRTCKSCLAIYLLVDDNSRKYICRYCQENLPRTHELCKQQLALFQ